ncbi:MAG: hypothetical protein JWQ43_4097 [Glaciihabitans sp.]|nr:hypothetical protein [Glaciihabitans sp.]
MTSIQVKQSTAGFGFVVVSARKSAGGSSAASRVAVLRPPAPAGIPAPTTRSYEEQQRPLRR